MAEVLAITGGLAAALQLSSFAIKFAKALYQLAADAGAAASEVERFANQVKIFSAAVTVAHRTLSNFCAENPKSPLVIFISSRRVLADIGTEASIVRRRLRRIRDKVMGMRSRSAVWAYIKWSFKKSSILNLHPEMEGVKTSLDLLISTAYLEAATRNKDGGRRSERQLLQQAVAQHLNTMRRLRSQLSSNDSHHGSGRGHYTPLSLDKSLHAALMELAQSMCEHGVVPEESPRSSRSTSQDSLGVHLRSDPPSPRGPPTPLIPDPMTRDPETPQAAKPHRFSNLLRFNGKLDVHASMDGWSASSRGEFRQVIALLARNLYVNLISINRARELGLEIKMLEPTEGVVFDFGTGRPERSVGRAVFQWHNSRFDNARYPPLTVVCEVCENSEIGLVLGRPFIEEAARRWPRTTGLTY